MKPKLKTLTWSDFDQHKPCYSPQEKYGDFSGTILDILNDKRIPNEDKIWAFTRKGIMDDKTLRLFAVRCVKQIQHLMTDQRSINALDVVERYANGLATEEELTKAREEAREAAYASARGEIWAPTRAAWAATWVSARKAAWEAARVAVGEAAIAAARAAARAADKVWEATRGTQVQIAIELVEEFYHH